MLKTKIFEKKAISPVKKRLWPTSSRIIEHDKRQRTTCKGPKGNLTINVEVRRPFLQDPRGCWIHKFLKKKATFQWRIDFRLFLPLSQNMMNVGEHLIGVQKVTWQLMLKLKDHFFRTQEVAEYINFWRKRQHFQWRIDFRLFLLVLQNMTNVGEHLIRVHKVTWQLMLKL